MGFFAKQMVLSAALDNGYIFLSLIAIITSVIGAVYVRPLINVMPGSLNPLSETLRDKPINLSDFEMNRGVQHVDKGLKSINYKDFIAKVILSHVKFNLQVNFAPVRSKIVDTILEKIRIKNILICIVSFCRPETTCLKEFAKRKISDITLRTGDLLREVIPKISFRLISSIVEGGRSFRSINSQCWEGKQNQINKLSSLCVQITDCIGIRLRSRVNEKPLLVRTVELRVNSTQMAMSQRRSLALARLFLFNNLTKRFTSDVAANKLQSTKQYFSLNPWFITGFSDAEGCFGIFLRKSSGGKSVRTVIPLFQIGLHKKDELLLREIQSNLGGIGSISYGQNTVFLKVQSLKQILAVIIPHFDIYPLITQKQTDYLLFRQIVTMMEQGEHLNKENLQSIVNIKASLNLGLSEDLKVAFPKTVAVPRPPVANLGIPNPEWVAGFASGEGCFYIGLWKESSRRLGVKAAAKFLICQHSRDELLMRSLVDYFGCGSYSTRVNSGEFVVVKLSDIAEKIIPFFNEHKIRGVKFSDFQDWCEVVKLMGAKKHLTPEGLEIISQIKAGSNKGRK